MLSSDVLEAFVFWIETITPVGEKTLFCGITVVHNIVVFPFNHGVQAVLAGITLCDSMHGAVCLEPRLQWHHTLLWGRRSSSLWVWVELSFSHFASRNCSLLPHFVSSISSLLIINLLWFGCEMLLSSHRLMSVKTVHGWWYHCATLRRWSLVGGSGSLESRLVVYPCPGFGLNFLLLHLLGCMLAAFSYCHR